MTLSSSASTASPPVAVSPTLWGLSPLQLLEKFWRRRGVMLVQPGIPFDGDQAPELYLLVPSDTLVLFNLRSLIEALQWITPVLMTIRLHGIRGPGSQPRATCMTRVGVTEDPSIARAWRTCGDVTAQWRLWRKSVPKQRKAVLSLKGTLCKAKSAAEVNWFMCQLAAAWRNPGLEISRAQRVRGRIWKDALTPLPGPVRARRTVVWLGAGRNEVPATDGSGAAVCWDQSPGSSSASS